MFPSSTVSFERSEIWVVVVFVAAFAALYRILRGAPFGQAVAPEEDPEVPSSRHRQKTIALVAAGLDLILVGAYAAMTRNVLWSIPFFAAGVGLVTVLNTRNRPYRHASPSLRRTIDYSGIFLNGALLAGILMIVNVIAFRHGGEGLDLTREQTHSLSSLSVNQLESLNRPVTFHVVYGRGPRSARQLDRVIQLLELYRSARPELIKVDILNPYTELARAEDLAKRAPDLAVMQGGGVLIEYGEGTDAEFTVVANNELFEPLAAGADSLDRFESAFKGEDAVTSALIRLREARKSKVAFTAGHGESSGSDLNPSGQGIGIWRTRLSSVGCELVDLNLISDPIPEDVTLLVIAGPKSPFKPEELTKLKAYAERGGPVLALVGNTEPTGLESFLKSFNLEIGRGLVIDPRLNFNRNVQLVFSLLKGGPSHPITTALQSDRAILVPNGAPIHVLGQAAPGRPPTQPVNSSLVPIAILRTGAQSWAETDMTNPRPSLDRSADEAGPITVGVAVQERTPAGPPPGQSASSAADPKPRLVLLSSRSIADNVVQGIEPTNLDLVMNAASWLRGRPDAVGIAPKTHVALTLTADPLLRARLVFVPTILALILIIGSGAIVYVARRE
jgi:hypothetical protein